MGQWRQSVREAVLPAVRSLSGTVSSTRATSTHAVCGLCAINPVLQ